MRVLVVTTWYPTAASPGTGVFVARDVAAIASRHDVRVLHLCAPALLGPGDRGYAAGPPGSPADVPVERLPMDPRRPDHVLRAARRVQRLAAGADVLHTMAVSALLPLAARRPPVPWVHTEHWSGLVAPATLTPALRAARLGIRRLLRRPDVVAVVGQDLAAGMRGMRDGTVEVVPNIVDAPARPVPRRDPARTLSVRGPLELVAVGGLVDRKDPLRAVEATAELRSRGVDARLTWVGDGPLRAPAARRAEQTRVPLTLAGAVPPHRVGELLGAADLFLLPTHAETFCVAAAEALAAGRPVVVGDSGGPRDFVAPPSGRLVPPGAPAPVWADAVEQVWDECASLSAQEIAAPVVAAFGPDRHAARVDDLYRHAATRLRDSGAARTPTGRLVRGAPHPDTGAPGAPRGRLVRGEPHPEAGVRGAPVSRAGAAEQPLVDVVIATHSARRHTDRAVRSVLDGSGDVPVRVTVVCHDLPAEEVAESLRAGTRGDPRVRLIEHRDGVASPAGPFTAGLAAATAPWVSVLGSDDSLAPSAVRHWLDVAAATGAEVVLAQVRLEGTPVPTPPTRVRPATPGRLRRRADLDLVRDRLSYRSAPLGLLSRAAVARTGARLLPGAATGEDVPFVTRLYAGARVALADGAPYLVGTDAQDRTTARPRPVREELLAPTHLLHDPWFTALPAAQRRAVATKLLRIHVFGLVVHRPDPSWWSAQERADLAGAARRLLDVAPGAADPLSLADHDLLAAVLDPAVPARRLVHLAQARRRHGAPRTLLPHDWRHALDREAPLRFMVSSLAARRG